jgi:sigma-B regulation protein RsbU (phosphoserine phosphatase)
MKEHLPAYYWEIEWEKSKKSSKDSTTIKLGQEIKRNISFDLKVSLTINGEILEFQSFFVQDVKKKTVEKDSAFGFAEALLKKNQGEDFKNYKLKNFSKDSTYTFNWKRTEPFWGEEIEVEIQTYQQKIIKYKKKFSPPVEILNISDHTSFVQIPTAILLLLYIFFIIFILVQKLRRDEISIKTGIGFTVVILLAFLINFLFSNYQEAYFEILILTFIISLFLVLALFAIISIGDSLCREVWPEKLTTFDAIRKLNILFPLFSQNIFRGIALAFLSLGIITIILKFYNLFYLINFNLKETDLSSHILLLPFLTVLTSALVNSSFRELIFRLITISFLKKKIRNNTWIILISAFLWIFNFMGNSGQVVIPVYLQFFNNFIIGLLFAYFFIKYDVITVFIGSFFLILIKETYPMLMWGDTFVFWNGISCWLFIGLFIVLALIGLKKKMDQQQVPRYEPPYIKRMQERERVKRELEIARKVQLSFLPRQVPQIPGLDVATVCIPATEVGGDYYDFIDMGNGRLGVVIGDVSGKGIPAAFHMTLTKGFLKSQAKETFSPRELLIRLNELFYENVSRGIFISMIYGIFDIPQKTFTFARAGHNPIIIRSSSSGQIDSLCPQGIALGLEKGKIFNKVVNEQQVTISKNDIYIFFTDGVSEAMNEKKVEFGENRLQKIVHNNSNVLANELIDIIQVKINEFVGNTSQHDDLTMIIVKIL